MLVELWCELNSSLGFGCWAMADEPGPRHTSHRGVSITNPISLCVLVSMLAFQNWKVDRTRTKTENKPKQTMEGHVGKDTLGFKATGDQGKVLAVCVFLITCHHCHLLLCFLLLLFFLTFCFLCYLLDHRT